MVENYNKMEFMSSSRQRIESENEKKDLERNNIEKAELDKDVLIGRISFLKNVLKELDITSEKKEEVMEEVAIFSSKLADMVDENEYFNIMNTINQNEISSSNEDDEKIAA